MSDCRETAIGGSGSATSPPNERVAALDGRVARANGQPASSPAGRSRNDVTIDEMMPPLQDTDPIMTALDVETSMLVAVAAVISGGSESAQRGILRRALPVVRAEWVEEVILQTYLFAGFPRALNAMRLWRAISGLPAPQTDQDTDENSCADWKERGLATCSAVYGHFYDRLRLNIAALHPALDGWMVTEGYGIVLGRPTLDLARRELCVVAACVASQQDRQLHSHLHGALHVGAAPAAVAEAVEVAIKAMGSMLDDDAPSRYRQLWNKVLTRHLARLAEHGGAAESAAIEASPGTSSPARPST